jgi:hypothetical protein
LTAEIFIIKNKGESYKNCKTSTGIIIPNNKLVKRTVPLAYKPDYSSFPIKRIICPLNEILRSCRTDPEDTGNSFLLLHKTAGIYIIMGYKPAPIIAISVIVIQSPFLYFLA